MTNRARWLTPEQKSELARLYTRGVSIADIARRYERNYSNIRRQIVAMYEDGTIQHYTPSRQKWTSEQVQELKYYYDRSCKVSDIADMMEINYWRINSKIQKMQQYHGWKRAE